MVDKDPLPRRQPDHQTKARPKVPPQPNRLDKNPVAPLGATFPLANRPAKRRSVSPLAIAIAMVGVLTVILLAGLLSSSQQSAEPSQPTKIATAEPAETSSSHDVTDLVTPMAGPSDSTGLSNAASKAKTAATPIEDDGETLWVSPTAGQPVELNYLPSGAQVLLVLRPAELLATSEGAKLFDALGPAGELAKTQLRTIWGVDLTDVEQLTITFSPDDSGAPRGAFVMRLRNPTPGTRLLEAWGHPEEAKVGAKHFFQAARFAYYLPPQTGGRVVAIAPASQMKEMLELEGPPLVRKGIERLLHQSDAARHFSLILAPGYLLTDGKALLVGDLEKLRDPLAQFLDEGLEAVLMS
ncbi:MAG TPA: hypothetical protein VGZ26_12865, partial [Pirellulales bacterium]|nr:hypothetical protein [Pirellulales bacterium]